MEYHINVTIVICKFVTLVSLKVPSGAFFSRFRLLPPQELRRGRPVRVVHVRVRGGLHQRIPGWVQHRGGAQGGGGGERRGGELENLRDSRGELPCNERWWGFFCPTNNGIARCTLTLATLVAVSDGVDIWIALRFSHH